jgi:hypothetical protein
VKQPWRSLTRHPQSYHHTRRPRARHRCLNPSSGFPSLSPSLFHGPSSVPCIDTTGNREPIPSDRPTPALTYEPTDYSYTPPVFSKWHGMRWMSRQRLHRSVPALVTFRTAAGTCARTTFSRVPYGRRRVWSACGARARRSRIANSDTRSE